MRTDFQFVGLPVESFTDLFSMTDADLAARGAKRMTVDAQPGFPCRRMRRSVKASFSRPFSITRRTHRTDQPVRSSCESTPRQRSPK